MSISAPKSSATLFTPWTRQVNATLYVKIGNDPVPTVKNPKLLGVVFDPLFTFAPHADRIAKRASAKLNILRALSDTSFGKDRDCLLLTYKLFIRSLFDYAAPITYPNYSNTSVEKLQRVQNRALRISLGCHAMSSVEHLHLEAGMLPVSDHLHLLSAQFLAKSLHPSHASFPFTTLDRGPRQLKHTLRSKVFSDLEPYVEADGTINRGNYEAVKKHLHTDIVSRAIGRSGPNRVRIYPPSRAQRRRQTPARLSGCPVSTPIWFLRQIARFSAKDWPLHYRNLPGLRF